MNFEMRLGFRSRAGLAFVAHLRPRWSIEAWIGRFGLAWCGGRFGVTTNGCINIPRV